MSKSKRSTYHGSKRALVLAFDVGTTYSGISYCVLDPGRVPEIRGITRFPAQDQVGGAAKIPTIIYYDLEGKVRAVGAEATQDGIHETAEEQHWVKAEWFKLHLRARPRDSNKIEGDIPPLPLNKSVVDVLSDYLKYLLTCASNFIQDTHPNGRELWDTVHDDIHFVLSHPNGWEGTQQSRYREAAALANLIPDTRSGHARLSFVTEGEASLHFSIENGLPSGAMQKGDGVLIIDAGGGTIDISCYSRDMTNSKGLFEEISMSQCHFFGSVFVSINAQLFLQRFLSDSPYVDDLVHIVRCFDKTTKHRFRNPADPQYIKFGLTRDNDEKYNIRFGQLKLQGTDVAKFFQPSLDCIVKAVMAQRNTSHRPISHVILLGGFSASDWLFEQVDLALSPSGLNVLRPTNHVNKAVSDGAVSFYLDRAVRTRVSKFTYGTFYAIPYNPDLPDHVARRSKIFTSIRKGTRRLRAFDPLLPKNTQVSETQEFREDYTASHRSMKDFKTRINIFCYRGSLENPTWRDIDPDNYTNLCEILLDFTHLTLPPTSTGTSQCYKMNYTLIFCFGLAELKVYAAWKENGVEHRTTPRIIYSPDE